MSQKKYIDRRDLAEMFRKGADRKMAEHQLFAMLAVEHPDRAALYHELFDYTDVDERYYRMAASYYSGDLESVDTGYEEDLLLLTDASELPPKLYADYLRELTPEDRREEKITHSALRELKGAMRAVLGVK